MKSFRTDLAAEIRDEYNKEYSKNHEGEPDGIEYSETKKNNIDITEISVTNKNGENILGKPQGKYITVYVGRISKLDSEKAVSASDIIAEQIGKLTTKEATLVVGLGNRYITADAIGPTAIKYVLATGHIKKMNPEIYKSAGFGNVYAFTTGVLAQTGIESSVMIKDMIKATEAERIIIIDSLAAKSVESLATTIQITDTGICPGSGVGNDRTELSKKTLGIETVAIGVPMIIDALTLINSYTEIQNSKSIENYYVCPKDTDAAVFEMAKIIGYGINKTCHKELSYEDMAYL